MIASKRVLVVVVLLACVAGLAALAVLRGEWVRRSPGAANEKAGAALATHGGERAVGTGLDPAAGRPGRSAGEGQRPTGVSRPKVPSGLVLVFEKSGGTVRRMKAVDALPRALPPEALIALRWLLRNRDEPESLRNNVASKLRECGEEHLVSDLTEMLWDEQETPKWRNYCVQHLYGCHEKKPDRAILDTILEAAEADEKMVKICAIWSLARIATPRDGGGPPDEKALGRGHELALAALRDEKAHFLVREAGVQSSARLGLTEALPDIRKLAANEDAKPMHLRVVAIAALGELKDAESTGFLKKLAKESTGQLRAAAELALKRIREAEATEEPPAPADQF